MTQSLDLIPAREFRAVRNEQRQGWLVFLMEGELYDREIFTSSAYREFGYAAGRIGQYCRNIMYIICRRNR